MAGHTNKLTTQIRKARLVRRAGQLHLVMPRAAGKRVGIDTGDTVSITCRNGRIEIVRAGKARRTPLLRRSGRSRVLRKGTTRKGTSGG